MLPVGRALQPGSNLHVDIEYIRGLLTRDSMARKAQRWRLLHTTEMQQMFERTKDWMYDNYTHDSPCYIVTRKDEFFDYPIDDERGIFDYDWSTVEERAIQSIEISFPLITALLLAFGGKIIAAGGAITRVLLIDIPEGTDDNDGCDIDLFFVDPEVQRSDLSDEHKRRRYNDLLVAAIAFLSNAWLERTERRGIVFVLRNNHVTTVYLSDIQLNLNIKYQFIHRVYPSLASVLGGFDLGPSMVAFDGHHIVATELGAWSALARTIIVDIGRRSTSFEYRLVKYAKFCHVLLPGLPANVEPSKAQQRKPIEEVQTLLTAHVIESALDMHTLSPKTDKLRVELCQLAYDNDYILNIDLYIESLQSNLPQPFVVEKFLKVAVFVVRLPAIEIQLPPRTHNSVEKSPQWNLRTPKNQQILYCTNPHLSESDYAYRDHYNELQILVASKRGNYSRRYIPNDYDNNPLWPPMIADDNLFKLVTGRLDGIVATTAIYFSSMHNHDDDSTQCVEGLGKARCDLDAPRVPKMSYLERIKFVLKQSLSNPIIVDWDTFSEYYRNSIDWARKRPIAERNLVLATERLSGIEWILQNAGRQWTSAINPIIADPRDWYGEHYCSFRIGNEAIETTLRLARLRSGNFFSEGRGKLPVDIFKIILQYSIFADSQ